MPILEPATYGCYQNMQWEEAEQQRLIVQVQLDDPAPLLTRLSSWHSRGVARAHLADLLVCAGLGSNTRIIDALDALDQLGEEGMALPASSHAKPEPDPAGTSVAVLWNWSMSTCSCVTNTVEGATARKIEVVLRSSSVRNFASSGRDDDDTAGDITEGTRANGCGAASARLGGSPASRRHAAKNRKARDRYVAESRRHIRLITAPLFVSRA